MFGKEKTLADILSKIPLPIREQVTYMNRFLLMLLLTLLIFNCSCRSGKEDLLILHAGSLSIPFKHMAGAFMEKYPEVSVRLEAAGSRTCARKITELNSPADVFASADSAVIRHLLMPRYADFCIDFATNEMVIMYTPKSRYADTISVQNWPDILLDPRVEYGHSNPDADPCGYRAMLCWQLAEKYYSRPGLYKTLIASRPLKNIRPKEVDLLALLETGELDYIFIYRSVAEQHGGSFLLLPDEINLGSVELSEHYSKVSLELNGSHPEETIIRKGTPMVYGITIPKSAASPEWAARFVVFVLGPEGRRIMEANNQPEIVPARVDNFEALPLIVLPFVRDTNIES